MRASLLGDWHRARPAQRFGSLIGGALILVGLAHPADPAALVMAIGVARQRCHRHARSRSASGGRIRRRR
jgi:hypothetical protein